VTFCLILLAALLIAAEALAMPAFIHWRGMRYRK
jgi:hypothetical protein